MDKHKIVCGMKMLDGSTTYPPGTCSCKKFNTLLPEKLNIFDALKKHDKTVCATTGKEYYLVPVEDLP